MIFDIQRCSIHDGAGLRTLVFFKGCPLRCLWCANPESQSYEQEIMETPNRCIGCERCVNSCSQGGIHLTEDGYRTERAVCVNCYKCVDNCFTNARQVTGKEYEVDELYREISKDRVFYAMHGGGVTFSGGEPFTHPEYLTQIVKRCKKGGINVNIETCGMGNFEKFKQALPYVDHIFFDVKHIDPEAHKKITGMSNKVILSNLHKISEKGIPITVRTPIVRGYTDDPENVRAIAEMLLKLPAVKEYELLKYHELGLPKYKALNRDYLLENVEPPSSEEMKTLVRIANKIFRGTNKKCFVVVDNNKEDYHVDVEEN